MMMLDWWLAGFAAWWGVTFARWTYDVLDRLMSRTLHPVSLPDAETFRARASAGRRAPPTPVRVNPTAGRIGTNL